MPPRKKTAAATAPAPEPTPAPAPAPEPTPVPVPVPVAPAPPASKKKSKKQVQVVALVTPDGIEGNFQPVEQRRSLIAHLHIHSNEVVFADTSIQYDPNPPKQPEPYDEEGDSLFSNYTRAAFENEPTLKAAEVNQDLGKPVPISDPLGNPQHATAVVSDDEKKALQPFYRCNLMVCYRETSETKQLPESVDVACFWCTEPFSNQPAVLPEREEKSVYRVYGNFCCPECALAYLLTENIDPHVRWERMSLLHRLYAEWYPTRIFPAPQRQSLKKFGGPMNIEQFRATVRGQQVRVDIQLPPLVSILGTMDTKPIDFYDNSVRGGSSTGIITDRINKAEEGLRLRRTKPLKDKDSTLDACMNISIKSKKMDKEAAGQN